MGAERRGWGIRDNYGWPTTMCGRSSRGLSAAGHGCRDATSRLHREAYGRFCERQRVRLPLPTRRTLAWLSKCRAVLIRWDKKASNYLGLLKLACSLLWLRRYYRLAGLR